MDFKKSKKLLKKISKIIDVLSENDEQPSCIENDLLRSYIRELYEVIGVEPGANKVVATPVAPISKPQPTNVIEVIEEDVPMTKVEAKPAVPVVEKPKKYVLPSNLVPPAPAVAPLATPTPTSTPTPVATESVPSFQPSASSGEDDLLNSLFQQEGGLDLSDRLGNLPIKDLSKGMGINEKIHTIQELFGGKKSEFDDVITTLNNFSSFEEAAAYLKQGAAKSFDWGSESKNQKAVTFIKLVRRRYR